MAKSKENTPKQRPELPVSELEKLRSRLSKLKPTKGNLTRLCRECAELDDGDVKNEIVRRIFFSDTFPGYSPELRASIFFDAGNAPPPDEILAEAGSGTALAAADAVLDTLPRNDGEKKRTLASSVLSRKNFCTKTFRRAVVSAGSNEDAEYLQRRLSRTMENLLATRGNIDASRFNAEFLESLLRIASSAGSPAFLSLALLFVPEGTGRTSVLERLEKTPRDAELARSVANTLRFDGEAFSLSKQERRILVDIAKSCASVPVFSTLESACRDGENDGYLLSSLASFVGENLEYGWTDLWKLVEAMSGSTSSEETEPAFLEAARKLVASFSTRRKHSTRSSTGGINIESVAKALSEWKNESARNTIFEAVFEKTKDGEHAIYTDVDERCLLAAAFLSGECEIGVEEKETEISDQRRITNLETVSQALSVPRSPFIENVNLKTFKTERAARASDAASKMLGHAYSRAVSNGMRARVLRVFLSTTSNMEKIYESKNALHLSGLSATIRDFLSGGGRIEEKLLEENLDAIRLPGRFLPVLFGIICRISDSSPGTNGKEPLRGAHLFAENILRCLVRNPEAEPQVDMKTVVEQCCVEKLDETDPRTGWNVVSKMFSEEFNKENRPLLELFADAMKRERSYSFASSVFSMADAFLRESTPPNGFFKSLLDTALESSHQGTISAVLSKKQAGLDDFGTCLFGTSHVEVERLVVDALVRLPFEPIMWNLTASYFKIPLHMTRLFISRKGPNSTDLLGEYFNTRAAPALERLALSALESGREESFETAARIFEASGTRAFSKSGIQLLKTVAEATSRADTGLGLNGRGILSFAKVMSTVVFDTSRDEETAGNPVSSGRVFAFLAERVFESEKKDDGEKSIPSNAVKILSTTWANYLLEVPEKGKPNSQKERGADAARNSVSNIFLAVGKYIASALASSSDFSPELLACAEDAVEWRHEEAATMVATEILAASSRMEKSFKTLFREDGVRVEASLKNAVESALSVDAPRGGKTFVALCDASRNASLLAEERNETLPPLACSYLARFINDETGCMSLLGHMSRNFSSGKRPFDPRTGEGKETRENVFSMLLKASEHASDEFAASVVAFLESNMGKAFFTRKKTPREMPDNEKAFFEKLAVLAAAYIEDEDGDPEVVL